MNTRIPTLAFLTLALLAPQTGAQTPVQPATKTAPSKVTIDFSGGTLAEFLEEVRKAAKGTNILAAANTNEVAVPALVVTNADVLGTLLSVANISSKSPTQVVRVDGSGTMFSVTVQDQRSRVAGQHVEKADHTSLRSWSLVGLTSRPSNLPEDARLSMPAKTILTAIETALAMMDTDQKVKPKIRYHEDSGLLFLLGTNEQLSAVDDTIGNIIRTLLEVRRDAMRANPRGAAGQSTPAGKAK